MIYSDFSKCVSTGSMVNLGIGEFFDLRSIRPTINKTMTVHQNGLWGKTPRPLS